MNWTQGVRYAFDLETTGVSPLDDQIVTATIVRLEADDTITPYEWLSCPSIEISDGAAAVHGISNERARAEGQNPTIVIEEIATKVAAVLSSKFPLIIYNAVFDLSMLEAETRRHGLTPLTERTPPVDTWPVIDSFVLARGVDTISRKFKNPDTGKGWSYKLGDVCERYKVTLDNAHNSTSDAVAAALLATKLVDRNSHLLDYDAPRFNQLQTTWHRERQRNFQQWVAREKKQDQYGDIDTSWPLHTALTQRVSV